MTPFPKIVRIESAGRCNFKCQHCPVGIHGNTRSLMSYDTFVKILDRLPEVPQTLVLYHGGEPLLNRDLERMIYHAKGQGVVKVKINSNASLLTLDRARTLQAAGLDDLYISFDGDSPEQNDKIRLGGNFYKHAPIVRQAARDIGLRVTIYNVRFNGETKTADYLREYFGNDVRYKTDYARVWAHEDKDSQPSTGVVYCNDLWQTFSILSNGDVVTCCEDLLGDYTYGNVLQQTPLEIWQAMESLRADFMEKSYPELCKHCWIVTGRQMTLG